MSQPYVEPCTFGATAWFEPGAPLETTVFTYPVEFMGWNPRPSQRLSRVNVVKYLSPVWDSYGRDTTENYFFNAKRSSLAQLRGWCFAIQLKDAQPRAAVRSPTLQLLTLYFSLTYAVSTLSLKYALCTVSYFHSISRLPLQHPQLRSIDWSLGFL